MEHTAAVYLMDKAGRFVSALDYHERFRFPNIIGEAPELQAVAIA